MELGQKDVSEERRQLIVGTEYDAERKDPLKIRK